MKSRPFLDFIHKDEQEAIVDRYLRRMKGEKILDNYQFKIITKQGLRWAEIRAVLIDWDGRPAALDLISDVTEKRKQAEEAAKEAEKVIKEGERRFNGFFNIPLIGVALLSVSGRWLEANDKLCSILGYSRNEIKDKSWDDISLEGDAFQDIKSLKDNPNENILLEKRFIKEDGKIVITDVSIHCVKKDNNSVDYYIAVIQDITERKRSEAMLIQALKIESVGRLASGVSHDMNNLLTPIIGYTDILISEMAPEDSRYNSVLQIQKAAESAKHLTHQLLSFSRKEEPDRKLIDINKIIADFEKILKRTVRENIGIKIYTKENIGPVKANVGQIEQILMNLSVNAQDAMSHGGTITINTSEVTIDESKVANPDIKTDRYILLEFNDTGCGIEESALEYIFEPFFTTKERDKGNGLGLATVYNIVNKYGGFIEVKSQKWKGTRFKLYFPVAEGEIQLAGETDQDTKLYQGTETIIIAEDNEMVRNTAADILRRHQYVVLTADSSYECLKIASSYDGEIDLLLTDVIMTDENGKELYGRLTTTHPNLKVAYMSGHTKELVRQQGIITKDVCFIQKPFSSQHLLEKVREILDKDD